MFRFTQGNILQANTDAIVNTVNTVGVMGKGIALAFKKQYPDNYKAYKAACDNGELEVGKMFVFETGLLQPRLIINFPTKKHWRHPSQYEYIEAGLADLVRVIEEKNIQSIAIPPLGCGNGGLDWARVRTMILESLETLSKKVDIVLYEPGYQPKQRQVKAVARLTPARAMLLQLIRQYQMLGEEPNALVVQKLAYLLQRCGEPLNLRYEKGFYGPYAHNLSKVIQALSPKYLRLGGDISKPYATVSLEPAIIPELKAYLENEMETQQRERLQKVSELISGFENMLGLELLATVDYAINQCPDCTLEEITASIHQWTNRKKQLLPPQHIQAAYAQLQGVELV